MRFIIILFYLSSFLLLGTVQAENVPSYKNSSKFQVDGLSGATTIKQEAPYENNINQVADLYFKPGANYKIYWDSFEQDLDFMQPPFEGDPYFIIKSGGTIKEKHKIERNQTNIEIKISSGYSNCGYTFVLADQNGNQVILESRGFCVDTDADQPLTFDQHFVMTSTPTLPLKDGELSGLEKDKARNEIKYFDNLGRITQQNTIAHTPIGNDLVVHYTYDEMGRQAKKHLPFPSNSGNGFFVDSPEEKAISKLSSSSFFSGNTNFYTETDFEKSPEGRQFEIGNPGDAWKISRDNQGNSNANGHTVKYKYKTNLQSDKVRLFTLENRYSAPEYYQENQLSIFIVKDENWSSSQSYINNNTIWEYKNKRGQVVLKRTYNNNEVLSTYYIYNDYGNLAFVLPPKVNADTDIVSYETIDLLCYRYLYDQRQRMIYKKLPGAAPVLMVYDNWDRLVLTQDGEQRGNTGTVVLPISGAESVHTYQNQSYQLKGDASLTLKEGFHFKASSSSDLYIGFSAPSNMQSKWTFTKYDVLSRPILTGEVTLTGTRASIQTKVDAETVHSESFSNNGVLKGYTNNAYPSVTESNLLTVTYYDNYDFVSINNANSTTSHAYSTTDHLPNRGFETSANTAVKGKATGALTQILDTDIFLKTATYYDDKYRVIQTISDNQLGGFDRVSTAYDFIGQAISTVHRHNNKTSNTYVTKDMTYDHAGRLTEVKMYNGSTLTSPSQTVVSNEYDELGQLKKKTLHGGEQEINYKYNVRGWLTKINDPDAASSSNKLFSMELKYTEGLLGSAAQYNGNIAAMKWSTYNSANQGKRAYGFTYDALNRLTKAEYGEGMNYTNNSMFDVPSISYDLNGNITSLLRYGKNGNSATLIDQLGYTYQGNQLKAVNDAVSSSLKLGFVDGAETTQEYHYDLNGNMTRDDNKGITKVEYNNLNLPSRVTLNGNKTIEYLYDAAGIKLEKRVFDSSGNENKQASQVYIGSFVYNGNLQLQKMLHDEGYIDGNNQWHYFLKDHLGNTRIDFVAGENGQAQDYHYYPFGMDFTSLNHINTDNQYKYNGKEIQADHNLDWYDYGARFYDAAIGRFHVQDKFAEKYFGLTPYNYTAGNPVKYIDINGDSIIIRYRKELIMYHKGKLTWANGDKRGKSYDGKGLKVKKDGRTKLRGFLRKTVNALNAIRNGGDTGSELISNIENNRHYVFIEKGKNGALGLTVSWNPRTKRSGFDTEGNSKRPSFIGLAHELAHAWDWMDDGQVDRRTWYRTGDKNIPRAEQYASFIENKIRYENGIPLRAYYGKSFDSESNKTDGTGKLLKNTNSPYGPTSIYGNHNFQRKEFIKGL